VAFTGSYANHLSALDNPESFQLIFCTTLKWLRITVFQYSPKQKSQSCHYKAVFAGHGTGQNGCVLDVGTRIHTNVLCISADISPVRLTF
jgi:hypothetical protein